MLFSFFAASTHRWEVLINNIEVSVKRLAETRWSVDYEAVKPVSEKPCQFVDSIEASETLETRCKAQGLLPAVCDFTFLCYLYFWGDVVEEVDLAQQYLQTKGVTLDIVYGVTSHILFLKV